MSGKGLFAGWALLAAVALAPMPVLSAQAPGRGGYGPGGFGRGGFGRGMGPGPIGPGGLLGVTSLTGLTNHGAAITNAPFSATALVTYGPRGRQAQVSLARDAQGRTYLKETIPANTNNANNSNNNNGNAANASREVIYITDPVAGKAYTVFTNRKEVVERNLPTPPAAAANGNGNGAGRRGPRGRGFGARMETVSLGSQQIDGVTANGERSVAHMMPLAGRRGFPGRGGYGRGGYGNGYGYGYQGRGGYGYGPGPGRRGPARGPVGGATITRTAWTAPSMHMVVNASNSGPNGQDLNYVVETLTSGEPDASLFTPPSTGYTVRQAPQRRGRGDNNGSNNNNSNGNGNNGGGQNRQSNQ